MSESNANSIVEVRGSDKEGLGIFVTRPIEAGEVIRQVSIVRDVTDAVPLDPEKVEFPEHCSYPDGRMVLYDFPDRHMNHSCDPNIYYDYSVFPPTTRAIRDIEAGEELTVDYLINNSGGDSWTCHCGASRCRGETGTSFFDLPISLQNEYRVYLAPWFVERHRQRLAYLDSER
ncbi:MAG: SET domain-containing protein [Pseudomonadota bacterium]